VCKRTAPGVDNFPNGEEAKKGKKKKRCWHTSDHYILGLPSRKDEPAFGSGFPSDTAGPHMQLTSVFALFWIAECLKWYIPAWARQKANSQSPWISTTIQNTKIVDYERKKYHSNFPILSNTSKFKGSRQ